MLRKLYKTCLMHRCYLSFFRQIRGVVLSPQQAAHEQPVWLNHSKVILVIHYNCIAGQSNKQMSQACIKIYRVGQKTALFLRLDIF